MKHFLLAASFCALCSAQQFDLSNATVAITAAHDAGDFDGVVVVSQNGKMILQTAMGFADRAAHVPNRVDTLFRLASLTKQVTALLIMQQVSSGKMSLEQPASRYLPALKPAVGRVTIRQLLQHVSGLPNPSDGPENEIPAFYQRTGPPAADVTKTALGFCSGTPKREPGGNFEYNNCDYIVLGALLERVTGLSFRSMVQERVIKPLALSSWGVFVSAANPKTALSYQANGTLDAPQNPATYGSAGALYGNALDIAKWDEALLTHKLLSEELTATMFRADPKLYGEALGSWAYDSKATTPPVHVVERQGDIGSLHLLNLLLPDEHASVVIISNTERADLFNTYSGKGLGYKLLQCFRKNAVAFGH